MLKNSMVLDPNGDGSQWLYRNMIILHQQHPLLLPYACYDIGRNELYIGVSTSKKVVKKMIDQYLNDDKNWTS
jgi:hypothetical protein